MARRSQVAAGDCVGTGDGNGSGGERPGSAGQSHGTLLSLCNAGFGGSETSPQTLVCPSQFKVVYNTTEGSVILHVSQPCQIKSEQVTNQL